MDMRKYVTDLCLPNGAKYRSTCPVCHTKDAFSASHEEGSLKWNCFENSCTVRGVSQEGMSAKDIYLALKREKVLDTCKPIELPDYVVARDKPVYQYTKKFGIEDADSYLYDIKDDRVVFLVKRKEDGQLVDAVGRATGSHWRKWWRYGKTSEPYICGNSPVAIVVEDAVSAAVCKTLGYTGFALLGTTLLPRHKQLLKSYSKVIVALDYDAQQKTRELARELGAKAVRLTEDIKYRRAVDIRALRDVGQSDIGEDDE